MSIVLNETKQAESVLEKGEVGSKPASTLFLLGKYYRQKMNFNKEKTFDRLNEFMRRHYKDYNPALWETTIENIAKKADKYLLREINSIPVTRSELNKIAEIGNIKYRQLLFTLLCYAKLHNAVSEKNNGWVNASIHEIYRAAKVTVKHKTDKYLYLNDLERTGFISFSDKNDNLNIKVNFIGMDDDILLNIEDFRELGYEYLNYSGNGEFIRCAECKRLIKRKGRNSKYCTVCAKEKELEKYKKYNATRNEPLFYIPSNP